MGNLIVGLIVLLAVVLAIRALYKEKKESGSCAFCSYAKGGQCDHVGHAELDQGALHLTREQQEILDRHTKRR